MKGTNKMVVNQETMVEALEYWLNWKVFTGGNYKVNVVKTKNGNIPKTFEIVFASIVPKDKS
jgi:hypothetical protein